MPAIKNVAIIGASGNLGSVVLSTLLASAEFTLTAITRPSSTATFPSGVNVIRADTSSLSELTEAFKGQDAVISIAATAGAGGQDVVIDAAIAARVSRFIPSEFGANTRKDRDTKLGQLLAAKVKNTDKLEELGREHEWFTWTALSTPLFFDWALKLGAVFLKPSTKSARVVDSGNELFSPSTLGFVGRAVLAILQRPEATANKYLAVSGLDVTQNQVLAAAEEITGTKFDISHVTSEELLKTADDKFAKHDHSGFVDVLEVHLYGDGAGHAIGKGDNAVLGLEKENLREVLKEVLKSA